mmetsp:Transcript_9174/g.23558  ORF Transcript_9174/g.23558 Transcript_9174/m.23558 type:complete len:100 (-) Transcript_9174:275-574(-)
MGPPAAGSLLEGVAEAEIVKSFEPEVPKIEAAVSAAGELGADDRWSSSFMQGLLHSLSLLEGADTSLLAASMKAFAPWDRRWPIMELYTGRRDGRAAGR